VWRKALYYLYLGLLMLAGVAAVVFVISVAIGVVPVIMGDDTLSGPGGVLIGLAAGVIGFVAAAAALAIAVLVLYFLGFFLIAVALFVILAVTLGLSPLVAPFALLGLFVWWMARRSARKQAERNARVEPAVEPGR
jgi:hypothetical protein